jgi:tRNA (mo5U34)-methyltransferase
VGEFDLVLFLGMLYHLQDPLAVLHNVSRVTRRMLIVETLVDMLGTRRPAAAFYPELEDAPGVDASNWWGPNYAAVIAMLHAVGFRRVKVVAKRPLAHRVARAIKLRVQEGRPIRETVQQGRAVFHAWK